MNKRILLSLILVNMLIIVLVFFLPLFKVFTFSDHRSDHPKIYYILMEDEQAFEIRYVHSIFLSNVFEQYRVTPRDQIQFLSMNYEDVGIGLPGYAEQGETLTVEDGIYTLTFENRVVDSFVLFVGDVDADLAFRYKGEEVNLKKHLTKGKSYLFEVERISLYDMMKGVKLNG
ncbi:DUF1850 domain-containing protein [Sporosarcina contaminans]|uniref:DUF1850 domain-containing protein n=1 Tax=Sporosarcina contaminans TaxID=633403 RepID=A0ABW3U0B2_9BACL